MHLHAAHPLLHVAVATGISRISNTEHSDATSKFAAAKRNHMFAYMAANNVASRWVSIDENVLDKVVSILLSWSAWKPIEVENQNIPDPQQCR
jgi:hypothetical protein